MPYYDQDYTTQPFTGTLPSMEAVGPSDARYSSSTSPHYQRKLDASHGRTLSGTDIEVCDEDTQPAWANNELRYYAEMDDVQANGIFDPPGSRPNIYPDAGVLSPRFNIPGYLARERMFAESEVRDVTTGRPNIYVNSGAVSMDSAAQIAFLERGAWDPPDPIVGASRAGKVKSRSIAWVRQNPMKIQSRTPPAIPSRGMSGLGQNEGLGTWGTLALLGVVGLAAGGLWATLAKGKKRK